MAAILPTEVVSQISEKINKCFNKDEIKAVWKNTPIQNAEKPYIYIQQLNTTHVKELRQRGERSYFMNIRAHPSDDEQYKQTWCNIIGDKLFETLDTINIGGMPVYGRNMRFEIVDNVLHFFVTYRFKVYKPDPTDVKMRTLHEEGFIAYKDNNYGKRG